jgi:hypothetical protein
MYIYRAMRENNALGYRGIEVKETEQINPTASLRVGTILESIPTLPEFPRKQSYLP